MKKSCGISAGDGGSKLEFDHAFNQLVAQLARKKQAKKQKKEETGSSRMCILSRVIDDSSSNTGQHMLFGSQASLKHSTINHDDDSSCREFRASVTDRGYQEQIIFGTRKNKDKKDFDEQDEFQHMTLHD